MSLSAGFGPDWSKQVVFPAASQILADASKISFASPLVTDWSKQVVFPAASQILADASTATRSWPSQSERIPKPSTRDLRRSVQPSSEVTGADIECLLGPTTYSNLAYRLGELHPNLVIKLQGAIERVMWPGNDAASQGANSAIELMNHALRCAAPQREVLAWVQRAGLQDRLRENGAPSLALCLRYVMQDRTETAAAVPVYEKLIQSLVPALEGMKHSLDAADPESLRVLLPLVAAVLAFALG